MNSSICIICHENIKDIYKMSTVCSCKVKYCEECFEIIQNNGLLCSICRIKKESNIYYLPIFLHLIIQLYKYLNKTNNLLLLCYNLLCITFIITIMMILLSIIIIFVLMIILYNFLMFLKRWFII